MSRRTLTDNHNPAAKLKLRRYFLEKYHKGSRCSVIDCCEGEGLVWGTLRREYANVDYWGVDIKRVKGRLQVDSVNLLSVGVPCDVIDVDTYGSPWAHWLALIEHVNSPTTVFLTESMVGPGGGMTQKCVREAMGIEFPTVQVPLSVLKHIRHHITPYMLGLAPARGLVVREAIEAVNPGGHAKYYGIRLEPPPYPP